MYQQTKKEPAKQKGDGVYRSIYPSHVAFSMPPGGNKDGVDVSYGRDDDTLYRRTHTTATNTEIIDCVTFAEIEKAGLWKTCYEPAKSALKLTGRMIGCDPEPGNMKD